MVHTLLMFLFITAVTFGSIGANPPYDDDYTTTTRGPHIVPRSEEKVSAPLSTGLQNQTTPSRLVKYIEDLCEGTIKEDYDTNLGLPVSRGVEFFVDAENFPPFSPQLVIGRDANRFRPFGRHQLIIHSTDRSAFSTEGTLCSWHRRVHAEAILQLSGFPEPFCRIVRFEDFGLSTLTGEPLTQISYVVYVHTFEADNSDDNAYNTFSTIYHPHPARFPSARELSEAVTSLELPVYRGPVYKHAPNLHNGEHSQVEMENLVTENFKPDNRRGRPCPNLRNSNMRFAIKTEPVFASGVAADGHIPLHNYTAFAHGIWINGTLFWQCGKGGHSCARGPSNYGGRGLSHQPTNREAAIGWVGWSKTALIPASFSRLIYPSVSSNIQYTKHIQEYLSAKLSDALGINNNSVVLKVILWYHFSANGTQLNVAIMYKLQSQNGPASSFFLDTRLPYAKHIFNKVTEISVDMTTWSLYHGADPAEITFTFLKQEYQRRDFYSLKEFDLLLSSIPVKKPEYYYGHDDNEQINNRTLNSSSVLAAVAQAFNESNPISVENVALEIVLTERIDGFLDIDRKNVSRLAFQLRYPEPAKFQFMWRYPSREQLVENLRILANATLAEPPILKQTD